MTERALAPIALLTDFRSSFVTKINPLATRNDLDQAVLVLSMAGRVCVVVLLCDVCCPDMCH